MSEGTQISLETVQLEWSPDELETAISQRREATTVSDCRIDDQARHSPSSDRCSVSEAGRSQGPEELETFLDGLRRAQEEQEQLEKRMAIERLNEELDLLPHQSSHPHGDWTLPVSGDQPAEAIHRRTSHPATQDGQTKPPLQRPMHDEPDSSLKQRVEINFWSLERGQWYQSDCLLIDRSDPSPVKRVAQKYSCKGYSLYDVHLHSLRPDHCYRAAIADGSNAIFLISVHEDSQLATEDRVGQEKRLISMASKVVSGTVGRSSNPENYE